MEARGAAPWVRLNAGELDVRYRGAEQELPSGDELALLWRNSYFIDTLKDITFELEGRH